MKTSGKYQPVFYSLAIIFGVLIGYALTGGFSKWKNRSSAQQKINNLVQLIEKEYVDNVNTDSIVDIAVSNILSQLDPHSVYIAADEMQEVTESMKGDFIGIGISFRIIQDSLTVIKPVENGPSFKAGIQGGDRIIAANSEILTGKKWDTINLHSILRGEENTEVRLKVYRKTDKKIHHFTVTRAVIPIKSVDVSTMINKETGYVRINRFAETTYKEFNAALQLLKEKGASHIVLDLRDNTGGIMEEAIKIADEFLPDKQLIVFTKNRSQRINNIYATNKGIFEKGKVSILINEQSASASEILAGAIQDNDRGNIIGRRSYGKGLIQREVAMNDGSAVRLTVARYYTPTGRSIQKPYIHGDFHYFEEYENRLKSGEFYSKDSIKIADSLKFKTPKGKIVYGGGGIVPDVFVPLEVEKGSESVLYILKSGILPDFAFKEIDQNRTFFQRKSLPELKAEILNKDVYFSRFTAYLSEHIGSVKKMENHKELVKHHILSAFAEQLFNENEAGRILLEPDEFLKTALKN